jgi:hypothetical protein
MKSNRASTLSPCDCKNSTRCSGHRCPSLWKRELTEQHTAVLAMASRGPGSRRHSAGPTSAGVSKVKIGR